MCSETHLNAKPKSVKCHFMKKETTKIYIDESGNTGQDLLNQDQKVFILSSNNFNESEINELKALFIDCNELHFVDLKKSEKGRKAIIEFLNHRLITENNIISVVAHKEIMVAGQIVDQLIEPVLFDNEIDIYKYGENIAATNFIFHFGNFFWDKELYKQMLTTFIKMIRSKEKNDIDNFYQVVQKLYDSELTQEKALVNLILLSKEQIQYVLENVNKFTIDVTLSSFFVLCDLWFKKTHLKLDIIQDNSKQIESQNEFIEFSKNIDIKPTEIGFGSRKLVFPTQINSLELVDSKEFSGVQISDLIASSLAFMYNNRNPKQEKFVKQIQESKLLQLSNYHTIWPTNEVTPEELNMETGQGINILDFLAFQSQKNGI